MLVAPFNEKVEASCWCGENPGMCDHCRQYDDIPLKALMLAGKIHIGSGEDADAHRELTK